MSGGTSRPWNGMNIWRIIHTVLFVAAVCSLVVSQMPATAQNDSAAISQSFQANNNMTLGALVSLTQTDNNNSVELANTSTAPELVGVVGEQALIELSDGKQGAQVVTSGTTVALVSDINGNIKAGDKVTASPISGVGMRTAGDVQIVGTAQADFSSIETTERAVNDRSGNQQFIHVGLLPIQINVTYFAKPDTTMSFLPGFMQDIAKSVAGRDVSALRVLVSATVLALGFISIGVLLYSAVRSSIISIGRNPLSERAVRKSLLGIGATAIGILLLTLVAIYLILRL